MKDWLLRLIPAIFRGNRPVVHAIRLTGVVGSVSPLRPGLSMHAVEATLKRAFSRKGLAAVAIQVNSPGGSAVQSALIHARIRVLAEKHNTPVLVFCEDVAASGGYWIACSGDEIYADASSIVGSIGVIAAGFGFVDAIARLGIERRVHTAGENKSILDPFQPEKPEDVARLLAIQGDVHDEFKTLVRTRRAGKLKGDESELFSGAFWSGRKALELGLIDGLGHMHEVLARRFGEKLDIRLIEKPQGWGLRRLGFSSAEAVLGRLAAALEERAMWSRFGL
ncbi:MAG: S49 family peptidase [Rhizobiales bacterium]|nr:S49 family peptidase [Hyphomicrobiales bacterium]